MKRVKIYENKKWYEFSELMKKKLGNICMLCDRDRTQTTLQIHHLAYEIGKKPWESPISDLALLCKGCHAREHDILEPNNSWILLDIIDNWSLSYRCERQKSLKKNCDAQIRYEHTIYHPKVGYKVVGSTCINHLTNEDQKISKDIIRETKDFFSKNEKLMIDTTIRNWKVKNIKNNKKITTFNIDKKTNNGNYKIDSVIYHNSNNFSLNIKIDEKLVQFENKKNNARHNYLYGNKDELIKFILFIDGIKKSRIHQKPHIEEYYRNQIQMYLNLLDVKLHLL